jgi:hypothetical protein
MSLRLAVDNERRVTILVAGKYYRTDEWQSAIYAHLKGMWSDTLSTFQEPSICFPPGLTLKYNSFEDRYYAFGIPDRVLTHYYPQQTFRTDSSKNNVQVGLATFVECSIVRQLIIKFTDSTELRLQKAPIGNEITCWATVQKQDPHLT